jgi:hypothetical protein
LRDTQPPPAVTVTPDQAKTGQVPDALKSAAAPDSALPPPPKPAEARNAR